MKPLTAATLFAISCAQAAAAPPQLEFADPALVSEYRPGTFHRVPYAADIDGDGTADLVTLGTYLSDDNELVLARGLGARQFTQPFEIPLSGTLEDLPAVGDLDGDGDDDLVAGFTEPDGRLVILRSEGGPLTEVFGPVQGRTRSYRLADADGDGDLDLYYQYLQGFFWRLRIAKIENGQFTGDVFTDPANPLTSAGFAITEWNGDGLADVLRGGAAHLVSPTAIGPGVGVVPAPVMVFQENRAYPFDLDRDGLDDFVVRSNGPSFPFQQFPNTAFLGDGALGFTETQLVQDQSTDIWDLADLNGDGLLDLIYVVDFFSPRLSLGNGSLPFPAGVPTSATGVLQFSFANPREDYDGDGIDDFASVPTGKERVTVHYGSPAGYVEDPDPLLRFPGVGIPVVSPELIDVDRDGDLDMLCLEDEALDHLVLIENLGGRVFAAARRIGPSFDPSTALVVGDFDGDSFDEVAVGGNDANVVAQFRFDATGTPIARAIIQSSLFAFRPPRIAGDLDGDGAEELIVGLRALLPGGPGGLEATPVAIPGSPDELQLHDLDGDGDLDLLNSSPSTPAPDIVENLGGLTFGPEISVPIAGQRAVGALDHDGDGTVDLIARDEHGLLLRRGLGPFGSYAPTEVLIGTGLPRATPNDIGLTEDVDLDGDVDFIVVRSNRVVENLIVHLNPAIGGPSPPVLVDLGPSMPEAWLGDMDRDGDLDVISRTEEAGLRLFESLVIPRVGTVACVPPVPNSSGGVGRLDVYGAPLASGSRLTLRASGLPAGQFGIFIGAPTTGAPVQLPGSDGVLCLTGALGRYQRPSEILFSGAGGSFALGVESNDLRSGAGVVPATVGLEWSFQGWHRDGFGAGLTSNTTEAVTVTFR